MGCCRQRGAQIEVPSGVKTSVRAGHVTLTWSPVSGARIYRVARSSTLEPEEKTVAMGLTTPTFTAPEPDRGETASYRIVAVGSDGVSAMSNAVEVTSPNPKRMDH